MTTKKKQLLNKTYKQFMEIGISSNNISGLTNIVAPDISGYGTTVDERLISLSDLRELLKNQKKQSKGLKLTWKKKPMSRHIAADGNSAVFADDLYLNVVTGKETIKMYLRFSVSLEYRNEKWIVVHWHGSKPENVQSEKDTYGIENWKRKAEELENLVKDRTQELLTKNRDLEIESSLERVRSVAMGMKRPEDMLKVCRIISDELSNFGVKEIRNIQTVIIRKEKGIYVCYQYFAAYKKSTVEDTYYQKNPVEKELVAKMLDVKGGYFEGSLKGKKLKQFRDHRKKENFLPDPKSDQSKEIFYYMYSIGEGALGITLYQDVKEIELAIFKRFHQVFTLAYKRFRDIEQAEAQARESQIQLALERVRARTMAMQNTSEFIEVIDVIGEQFIKLGFDFDWVNFSANGIDVSNGIDIWNFVVIPGKYKGANRVFIPFFDHPVFRVAFEKFREYRATGNDFYTLNLAKKVKDKFVDHLFTNTVYKDLPDEIKKIHYNGNGYITSSVFLKDTWLSIGSYKGSPFTEEQNSILKRFGNGFGQAYTRFLDLQKAEAQAREAQIQLALERVRAKTMAMQKSDELKETTLVLFQQFKSLGATPAQVSICIFDEEIKMGEMFVTLNGEKIDRSFPMELDKETFVMKKAKRAFLNKQKKFSCAIKGKQLQNYNHWRNKFVDKKRWDESDFVRKQAWNVNTVFFSRGMMGISSDAQASEEAIKLLERFANVFDLTFTRFLDLQKAEAQARESLIEAALERVRSRAMAMHSSKELREVAREMRNQFSLLGLKELETCAIHLWNESSHQLEAWAALRNPDNTGEIIESETSFDIKGIRLLEESLQQYLAGKKDYVLISDAERAKEFFNALKPAAPKAYAFLTQTISKAKPNESSAYWSVSDFSGGSLVMVTYNPPDENSRVLLRRFTNVFGQAYQRFKDLQKAEAQAREAQIQLALERVRAKTMAMQKSEELNNAASEMFKQIQSLGMQPWACGFNIFDKNEKAVTQYMSLADGGISPPFRTPLTEDPFFVNIYDARQRKDELLVMESKGESLAETYRYMFRLPGSGEIFGDLENSGFEMPKFQITHCAYFSQGYLVFITYDQVPEAHDIFKRFAKVFEQTYTRFLDLQKAEAQARESQIQLALERVRARTMAMHNSSELGEVAALLFEQIKKLGIVNYASGFNIWDKEHKNILSWMSNPTGSINPPFEMPIQTYDQHLKIHKAWKNKEVFLEDDIKGNRIIKHYQFLRSFPLLDQAFRKSEAAGINTPGRQVHNIAFFSKGFLLFISLEPCPQFRDIFIRFANVFEQTYTRFLDLQKAEAQARESQIQLALERVRARTMAMYKSDELAETTRVLFTEFKKLNVLTDAGIPDRAFISTVNEKKEVIEFWITALDGSEINKMFEGSIKEPIVFNRAYKAWKKQQKSLVIDVSGDDLIKYLDYLKSIGFPVNEELYELHRVNSVAFFSKGFIGITSLKLLPPESIQMMERFAQAFDITYTRFLDLQKAEAQAREAQIEAALERVRSRSMAMHKSDELKEVIRLVLDQFIHLKINAQHAGFYIDYKNQDDMHIWLADPNLEPFFAILPYFDTPTWNSFIEAKTKGIAFHTDLLDFEEKNKFYNSLFQLFIIPEEAKEFYMQCKGLAVSTVMLDNVGLYIENFEAIPYSDDENKILMRFGKVFQQTYTRFLDLQKAEAQAREAQIEAGLERVRSRAMAMQSSEEVNALIGTVFTELTKLDLILTRCIIWIFEPVTHAARWWMANIEEPSTPMNFYIKYHEHPAYLRFVEEWEKQNVKFVYDLKGQDKINWDDFFFNETELKNLPEIVKNGMRAPERVLLSASFNNFGGINVASLEPLSDEHFNILLRFAKVFDLTYTRFLDLKNAEAQAREAKIEVAMEKVRARAMAMQKPNELIEVAQLLRKEMGLLGVEELETSSIYIHDETTVKTECWYAIMKKEEQEKKLVSDHMIIDLRETGVGSQMLAFYNSDKKQISIPMKGNERKEWINYCADHSKVLEGFYGDSIPDRTYHLYKFSGGFMGAASPGDISAESWDLLKRATNVFSLAYTRFSDLQKAEAQARESQIEAALERVRAKTMAMQKSDELLPTAEIMFDQMKQLGAELQGVAFAICDEDSTMVQKWTSIGNFSHPFDIEPGEQRMYEAWKNQSGMCEEVYEGKKQKRYYELFMEIPEFRQGLQKVIDMGFPIPTWQKNYAVPFKNGYVLFIITKPFDETQIFLRFGKVFEQTYTRFLDLQAAEANAKEAVKQAALDRIRADIASMRTTKDLERITPLIWKELNILGIPFVRCGVFIMDEEAALIHTFLSTPEGEAITTIHIPYDTPGKISLIPKNWKKKTSYTDHWNDADFIDFANALQQNHAFESPEKYLEGIPHGGFYLHFLPFLQGMMYVGNPAQLNEDEIILVQSVADAFSSAYSRYEDFNKLEAAKQKVDSTLNELQATQKQLIQSEKMASLGELTAGIAHEIQNPLNFVNNFSDVNKEMLEELKAERSKPKTEQDEQLKDDLINDVIVNSEKINLHGKRAADIVKGMLQHSRKSTGQKEPTDINALCDEYLRLSYHGLRAKDKSFNAEMKTDFDKSLPKINVIPQDIGRVFLNLFNNAFYAASLPSKGGFKEHEPSVSVTTKKIDNKVEIVVKDNGNGIPQNIIDKIFQPFFTTKPTGEGTGLGLSLSYDIVKAHGGEINVKSKEGEETEFIIQLPV